MSTSDPSDQGPQAPGSPAGPPAPGPGGPTPTPGPGTGGPAPTSGPEPTPGSTDHVASFFASVRRTGLVRTPDRWIGGVASGLALRLGIDALLVRAAFGVLALISGAGLVLYALAWALLPEQSDGRIHLEETIRGRFDAAIAGAGLLLVVGLSWDPGRFGWWGPWGFGWLDDLFGIALVAFVVSVFVTARRRRRDGAAAGASGTGTPWSSPGTPGYGSPAAPPYPGAAPGSAGSPGSATGPSWPGATDATTAGPGSSTTTYTGPSLDKRPTGAAAPPPRSSSGPLPGSYGPPAGATAPWGRPAAPAPSPTAPTAPTAPAAPAAPTVIGWSSEHKTEKKVSGPGRATVGLVAGLALLAFAGLLVADRSESFDGNVGVTTFGVLAVLAGVGIAVAGLRGRRSGTLGFFAIVAIVLASPLVALQGVGSGLGAGFDAGSTTFMGDSTYRPTSSEVATDGFAVGLGSTTVDLTGIDLPRGETVEVPVHVGAGDLTVLVPADTPVSAQVDVGAGSIEWRLDDDWSTESGVGRSTSFENQAVRDGETARIHVTVAAGAGKITIEETS
ncbi:LiaF-related protein [Sanguibacter sp. 4.1]|uniref:LiaF-related protein n=1 Tax=Sanguibacter biliveldensis TaxID=3030830 RepID=A0AAF0Z1Y4_9MICO|nr:LiaF domain-containing protein [Sanguibacter sp. 4.1]WPF81503.1 LiaF-related protein [Sanguibacter sp. 4.1]